MDANYFTFQSITQAQTASAKLQQHGFAAVTRRAPKVISKSGCGYAVQLRPSDVYGAIFVLRNAGIFPKKIFRTDEIGEAREVFL